MEEQICIFNFKYDCNPGDCSQNKDNARINSIINASKLYSDDLHNTLQRQLDDNPSLKVWYHMNCVSKYVSPRTLSRIQHRVLPRQTQRKLRRSHSSFHFQTHCLYCGEECDLQKDRKNPTRWRYAYQCRSAVSSTDSRPYKEFILGICSERKDEWGDEVRVRIEGAVSDLHAAEARYHVDCYSRFVSYKYLPGKRTKPQSEQSHQERDSGLIYLIDLLTNDKQQIWNSVELFQEYHSHGGGMMSRGLLVQKLVKHFSGELVALSAPGYAQIIAFRGHAFVQLMTVKDDDDDIVPSIDKLSKQVIKECKDLHLDKSSYRLDLNIHTAEEAISKSLLTFLSALSPKLKSHCLPAIMIGNIITGVLRNQPTDLQIALGVLLRDSKKLLTYMHDYGVTCSYDEVLRFKKSAAVAASADPSSLGISSSGSMIQVIVDNFDTDISSPNGKASTHSLAMILTQPVKNQNFHAHETFPRLTRTAAKLPIDDDGDDYIIYDNVGQKKPAMPNMPQFPLPEEQTTLESVSMNRAKEIDFKFFKAMNDSEDCPEYNGYNTRLCREQGHSVQPKTRVVYLPMINQPPADPSTMMAAMLRAKSVTENTGQEFVVITADQQLYRVAVHIMWENQTLFSNVYLRLGGMHLLMSYIGCVGSLMTGSGLFEVLNVTFAGASKMLAGRKFPNNVRALRMLVEGLLCPVFKGNPGLQTMDDLLHALDDLSSNSRTARLWIDCVIIPVFNMMRYIRAERESDWPLHVAVVRDMMPLFFAASHLNYARYGLYYLRTMEQLPKEVCDCFLRGEHTMHHNPGIFNGIWSDMAIETTFMRYGHGQSGIIGLTLKPEAVKTWAFSMHACNTIVNNLDVMRDDDYSVIGELSQTKHKEESRARIMNDSADRQGIKRKLNACIDPLYENQYTDKLVNIVTGQVINNTSVNADNAIQIGRQQMEEFENGWPESFHETIHRSVTTIPTGKKSIRVGDKEVFDPEAIYARAMALQNSIRGFDTKDLMTYELSPLPSSMFTERGMRISTTKATLKDKLKVECLSRLVTMDATFLDGCAILWVIPWSNSGTVQDYLDGFRRHLSSYLQNGPVYLIFDRYNEMSIKESTRSMRDSGASRVYSLTTTTQLPPREVMLSVTKNKKQLIQLIVLDLMSNKALLDGKVIVTGASSIPVEIALSNITQRVDMRNTHEEADTIIIHQILKADVENVVVVADDTDLFVLLCHFIFNKIIRGQVKMVSPKKDRKMIDINRTVLEHSGVMENLLAAHGLSGCDTVATYFGIGKSSVLKILKTNKYPLDALGDQDSPLQNVFQQATPFILACYGLSKCQTMTEGRQKMWSQKVGRTIGGAPKLQTLPPTTEAFEMNIARAHLQVAIWIHAEYPDPPSLNPELYGWHRDGTCLTPLALPPNVHQAPDQLLKLIKCACDSAQSCKSKRCGCNTADMACTDFCACRATLRSCFNPKTRERLQIIEEDEDSNDEMTDEHIYESD